MSKINDGGPAFPFHRTVGAPPEGGMTLRDWFAGQALAGICANGHTPWAPDVADIEDAEVARAAYDLADAMISARSNREEDNG